MTCTHTLQRSRWVEADDFEEGHWEYWTESTTADLDVHRYQCTQCSRIMYYSGAARQHFEEGKKFDIPGLGG